MIDAQTIVHMTKLSDTKQAKAATAHETPSDHHAVLCRRLGNLPFILLGAELSDLSGVCVR